MGLDAPNSPFKIVHHPDRVEALRRGEQPVPVQVQIVLSDLCNHDCYFCTYRMSGFPSNQLFRVVDPATGAVNNNPSRLMPYEKAAEVLEDCAAMGVKSVDFTGGGEPTVHPRHRELFQKTLELGLDLALVTNGLLLAGETIDVLARATFVRFSLDAGTPATYARVHRTRPEEFHRVLRNIRSLAVRRNGSKGLAVGVNFVVTQDNWGEAVLAAQLAREAGASYFRLAAMYSNDGAGYDRGLGPDGRLSSDIQAACEAVRRLEAPGFAIHDQVASRINDFKGSPPHSFCGHMHTNTYIGADLNVYRCCHYAYNTRGLIGSIAGRRFRELWESREKQAGFDSFDARQCDWCPVAEKNRFIRYLLDAQPLHVNFV